jgi:uncharacterized tellurite resistance protein B-like protein
VRLLDQIRTHLERRNAQALAHDAQGAEADVELQAATTILLLEAAYGDTEYVWREHRAIIRGLEREFGLGREQILELLGRANEIRPPIVKLSDVTDVLRDRYSPEQRAEVVRLVWRVIQADGVVEEWEEIFADHIAGAVGLDREEAARARSEAQKR